MMHSVGLFIFCSIGMREPVHWSSSKKFVFTIGGIILYKQRDRIQFLRGKRWPGTVCSLLGCASLVTTAVQYIL